QTRALLPIVASRSIAQRRALARSDSIITLPTEVIIVLVSSLPRDSEVHRAAHSTACSRVAGESKASQIALQSCAETGPTSRKTRSAAFARHASSPRTASASESEASVTCLLFWLTNAIS